MVLVVYGEESISVAVAELVICDPGPQNWLVSSSMATLYSFAGYGRQGREVSLQRRYDFPRAITLIFAFAHYQYSQSEVSASETGAVWVNLKHYLNRPA